MNIEGIKPCPFGCVLDEDEIGIFKGEDRYPWADRPIYYYQVACSCGALGPHGYTREEAIVRWNGRTNES